MRVLHDVVHALSSVFGCPHDRMTRPFTIDRQSYMVCLECGRKVFYSTEQMRRLSRREVRQLSAANAAVLPMPAARSKPASSSDPTIAA